MKKLLFILIFCSVGASAPLFNAFNSGELSPLIKYRVDLEKRQMGVETMENFLVKQQGAAFRRPGTEYIYSAKNSNCASELIPFVYSTGDAYVVEMSDESARFYRTVDGNSGIVLTGVAAEDISDMILHWEMDDDDGSTTVIDSQYNYDGTAQQNTEDVNTDGKIGGALNFNGSSDYIDVGDSLNTTFQNSFSVSMWIKPDDGQPDDIKYFIGTREVTSMVWHINFDTIGRIGTSYSGVNGNSAYARENTASLSDGQESWHHIVIVYVADTQIYIYVDGVLRTLQSGTNNGDATSVTFADWNNDNNVYVGALNKNNTPESHFAGEIDEVKIFSKALSSYEVALLYGIPISHWWLNDNEGSTIVVDSKKNHNGTADTNTINLYNSSGVANSCFDLDSEHYITVSDHSDFSFDDSGDNPFTITAWVFPSDTGAAQNIFSKWVEGGSSEYRLYLDNNLKLTFELSGTTADLEPNCISQWKLNENDSNTTVIDAIALQNGTATANTSNLAVSGKIDGGFGFDGQYAVVVDDNDSYTFSGDSPFSLALWVKCESEEDDALISKWKTSANREWKLSYDYVDSSTVRFLMEMYSETAIDTLYRYSGTTTKTGNPWHFVVMTYDGSETYQGITFYIDGSADNGTGFKNTYSGMANKAANVVIGAEYILGLANFYHGALDDVMIFNKELSSSEIQYLYNSGLGTEELVAGSTVYSKSDDAISDNQWVLVSATYDSTGGATAANGIILYVDGAEVNSTAYNDANYVSMPNTSTDILIGAEFDSSDSQQNIFAGRIDNVAVFNGNLSSAEIANYYATSCYEIDTPYDVNDLDEVKYVQKNDVMYMCHPNYPVQKLSRYAHTYWTIEDVNWTWGPFLADNIEDINITPSATTGNITLTASKNLFVPEHEGALWKITERQTTTYLKETISSNTSTSSMPVEGKYLLKLVSLGCDATVILEKSNDDGDAWVPVYQRPGVDTTTDFDVEYSDEEAESGWEYRVTTEDRTGGQGPIKMTLTVYDAYRDGYVEITDYISPTVVNAKVRSELAGTSATDKWAEGAWSEYRGYPRAVGLYQNRLCLAGNSHLPNNFWASASGDYENMQVSSLDTAAIDYEVASARQNSILWLQDKQGIMAGTADSLIRIFSQSTDATLTNESIGSERQSQIGSGDLQAQLLGESILFTGRNNRKVYDTIYDLSSESFVAPELTVYAEHITDPNITEMAVQLNPDPVLWCIKGDGNCVTLSYNSSQGLVAWAEHSTDGEFESVCVIPGETEDEIWFEIKRTIDSNDVRYIEKLKEQDWGSDANNCWFVDSGLDYSGSETNSITGLDHLEGKSVQVFYGGDSFQTATVDSNGAVALDVNVTAATIGLPFTSTLVTFPIELSLQGGVSIGHKKKIYEITGCFYKSMNGDYGYVPQFNAESLYPIPFSSWPNSFMGSTAPYTGEIRLENSSDWEREIKLKFVQDEPYPLNLTAISFKMEVSDE